MAVADRWHKARPTTDEARCEHGQVPTADHGRGDRWVARWRDPGGRQRARSFRRRGDAERHLTAVTADLHRGVYVDPAAGKVTVAEVARAWAAARPHRRSTAAGVRTTISRHIAGAPIGAVPVAKLRPSDCQAWATGLTKSLAPSTARRVLYTLRAVLHAAVDDGLIAANPARRVKLPKAERPRVIPLTVAQVMSLADAMRPGYYRAAVVAQAGLGLRVGELLALRIADVDFLRRTVRVEWQIEAATGARVRPKTPRSIRTLPLPAFVAEALSRHIDTYSPGDGRLFPMATSSFETAFKKAARTSGLEHTTSHALRHHYASVLLFAGESVVAVAERLGHDNAQLVIGTYGHCPVPAKMSHRRPADMRDSDRWDGDGDRLVPPT